MYEDDHLEDGYEDRFYIDDTDCGDGYTWGWEGSEDPDFLS